MSKHNSLLAWSAALLTLLVAASATAGPLSPQSRARLAAGQVVQVIVEFEAAQADLAATSERKRRGLQHDDDAISELRAQRYAPGKRTLEATERGADAQPVRDYHYLPVSTWRISSLAALERLQSNPLVRAVHEDGVLHVNVVSDLGFINQPQASAAGATGAGTTIAVIDGGLAGNYLSFADFGGCTGVATPAATCRIAYNQDFYGGAAASTVSAHGTNVSAIALGVAPGARLAMFNVFSGVNAAFSDVMTAIDTIIRIHATYNIVAVNMSLGDNASNPTQCSGSVLLPSVSNLTRAGIITVVAAGNSGSKAGLAEPACVPGVVSVGAVYDAAYGTINWGGACAAPDASAPDVVTCFSQSAGYLTLLAPGTFVNAPTAAFQESGTSQATPHVAGALAVLRARYPAEPITQSVQRLTDTGVRDSDPNASNRVQPRLDLLAAANEATAVTLTGSGPGQAVAGGSANYSLTVSNAGPLIATGVQVSDTLPAGATVTSMSPGCSIAGNVVTCIIASLAAGAPQTFTIRVNWATGGPVYDSATLRIDQFDSAAPGQQMLAFGAPPIGQGDDADGPLPPWSYALLACALLGIAGQRRRATQAGLH